MQVFGILNVASNSFSGDDNYNVFSRLNLLIEQSVDIIDVGAESTRPNAPYVTAAEEIARLENVLPEIIRISHENGKKVSLDTYKPETALYGINLGVDIINDVSCFADINMLDVIKNSSVDYVFMHNLGLPANKAIYVPEHIDIIDFLVDFYKEKVAILQDVLGTNRNLIFDPGIGFGKTIGQDKEIIARAAELIARVSHKVLFGYSRKSFLEMKDKSNEDKDIATSKITENLLNLGASYVRLHNYIKLNEYSN